MSRLEKLSGSTGVILIGFATYVLMSREDEQRSRRERSLDARAAVKFPRGERKLGS